MLQDGMMIALVVFYSDGFKTKDKDTIMDFVELLAPAGSKEALCGAITAGADAVYLGLDAFNARRSAENFTLESLEEACDYVHLRGRRVYIALNTIILPSEVSSALELARQAYRRGADAFIVQDIGIASELARTLPEGRLHVSTQMNIHNKAGLAAAAALGASRVTLARELSLEEIAELAQEAEKLSLELEAFCHGALCICYSGQCYMSSMIGGRSANRGQCAQACRLPYTLHNKALRKNLPSPGEHLLSPEDLCTIDHLGELVAAGIKSLKIEGRMKSADYVYSTTLAYREQLDRVLAAQTTGASANLCATEVARQSLEEVFSRGFTTAYLTHDRSSDIMSYGRPNNRGVFIGRVTKVGKGMASVSVDRPLKRGDILEFWTGKGHFAYTVDSDHGALDRDVVLRPDKPVGKGDRVFRVRSAERAFEANPFEPRVPVDGEVDVRLGQAACVAFWPAQSPRNALGDNGAEVPCVGEALGGIVEPARTKPLTTEDILAHVDRLGQTPYRLNHCAVSLDTGAGMGFSALHHLRSEALDNLTEVLLAPEKSRPLPRVTPRVELPKVTARGMKIAVWATNPACAKAARKAGADIVYVPALNAAPKEAIIAGQRSQTAEHVPYPKDCVIALPVIDHEVLPQTREGQRAIDVWSQVSPHQPVLVESLGALKRATDLKAEVEIGPHLPLTNALSLQVVAAWGAKRAYLSPELTLNQIADLAKSSPLELGITVAGYQELMVTEHCLLMSQGPCDENCDVCPRRKSPHYLKDRKGYEFSVVTDSLGRSHLYNAVEYDALPSMPDLMAAGVGVVMIDATLYTVEQTTQAVKRAVRARSVAHADGNSIAKIEGTTTGHLFRGVK